MSARTHPRLVGAFVLGAVALVLVAVLLLSGRGWFERRERFSVYFPGSLRGLDKGAAVTFRGIKVGEVVEVKALVTGQASRPSRSRSCSRWWVTCSRPPPAWRAPFWRAPPPRYARELVAGASAAVS